MYRLNCSFSGGAFAVPNEIADKYLKLAPAAGFKVLLFIFRNPDGVKDIKQISFCTGLSESDAEDCLEYWLNENIIVKDNTENGEKSAEAVSNLKTNDVSFDLPAGKKNISAKPKMPTQGEVAKRLSEDKILAGINSEAQLIIGSYGYGMQSVIVYLYDFYGFSPEIIITLLQFAKENGNASPNFVKSHGEDWAKRQIDTIEAVEDEIRAVNTVKTAYNAISEKIGLTSKSPSPKISKYLREWCVLWGFSDEAVLYILLKNSKSFGEANKELKKLMLSGITDFEKIKEKDKKSISTKSETTYDINNVGKNSVLDLIKSYENK